MSYRPPKSAILREYERKQRPSLLNRLFREHNVYIRTDGGVRHVAIRPWMQAVALGLVAATGLWSVYATASAVSKSRMLARKDDHLARERTIREESLARQAALFASRRAEMERQIQELKGQLMADQEAWLEKVEALRQDYERLLERQRILDRELGRAGLTAPSGGKKNKHTEGDRQSGTLRLRPRQDSLSPDPASNDLRVRFSGRIRTPEQAEAVLDILRGMREQARQRQVALLDAARKKAERQLAKARAVFRRLKLDPVRIARKAHKVPEAQGGAFHTCRSSCRNGWRDCRSHEPHCRSPGRNRRSETGAGTASGAEAHEYLPPHFIPFRLPFRSFSAQVGAACWNRLQGRIRCPRSCDSPRNRGTGRMDGQLRQTCGNTA